MKLVQECASRYEWLQVAVLSNTDKSKSYTVDVPPWDWNRQESICECTGYEFRGRCRHQHEALQRICNWGELDSEPQTTEQRNYHICPECGGPTKLVEVENGD